MDAKAWRRNVFGGIAAALTAAFARATMCVRAVWALRARAAGAPASARVILYYI